MSRNPDEYPDPEQFKPERWLIGKGEKDPIPASNLAFGFGRRYVWDFPGKFLLSNHERARVCPGKDFAENAVSTM